MTSADSRDHLLESAIRAARAGKRSEAYLLLRRILDANPCNEVAWLWLAAVTDAPREARIALRRVERLNPDSPRLAAARSWLEAQTFAPDVAAAARTEVGSEAATTEDATPIVLETVMADDESDAAGAATVVPSEVLQAEAKPEAAVAVPVEATGSGAQLDQGAAQPDPLAGAQSEAVATAARSDPTGSETNVATDLSAMAVPTDGGREAAVAKREEITLAPTDTVPAEERAATSGDKPDVASAVHPMPDVAEAVPEPAEVEAGSPTVAAPPQDGPAEMTPGLQAPNAEDLSAQGRPEERDPDGDTSSLPPSLEENEGPARQGDDTRPVPPIAPPTASGADTTGDADTRPLGPVGGPPAIDWSREQIRRRECRFWLMVLLSLGILALVALVALIAWVRVNSGAMSLAPTATPIPSQRALALLPDANYAIAEARLADAVMALEAIHRADASNDAWQHSAANAYYRLGVDRRRAGDLPAALDALDRAIELAPDAPDLRPEQQTAEAIRNGLSYYNNGEWAAAIDALAPVYHSDPTATELAGYLYSAYLNQGTLLQAGGDLEAALNAYQSALVVEPTNLAALQRVEEVTWLLRPPTPTMSPTPAPLPTFTAAPVPSATPTPKPHAQLIVVDVSDQHMYVYENDRLLWDWVTSTGEPGRDTATGRFEVLDKIDVAYASTWDLDMPYWLGIYDSGPLENGIHALPINRASGGKMWDGLLGQRVSYGCVILDDEHARTLFDWARVGTPVIIQW